MKLRMYFILEDSDMYSHVDKEVTGAFYFEKRRILLFFSLSKN